MMKRLLVLLCCVGVCCFAAVAVRLFYMQVIDYEFYQGRGGQPADPGCGGARRPGDHLRPKL